MILRQKGLLSNCEQLFTPMSSDEEGLLRGGFGGISVLSDNGATNMGCINSPCTNVSCKNNICGNGDCRNSFCNNRDCYVQEGGDTETGTTEVSETTTSLPIGGPVLLGFI